MTVGSFGWQLHSPGRWSSPAKLSWSCLVKYWVFKLLAGLLYCCSRPWAVSCELQKHGVCLAPCIWHLASCILQKMCLTSYILTLASYILHLTKTVACILHLVARVQAFYANCGSWVLSASQPKFVIMPLFPISCDYLCLIAHVWRFDHLTGRHGWFGWAFSDVNLSFFSKNKTDEKELGVIVMWMIITSVFHKCLITSDFQWTLSDASCWVSWSRQRSLIEICFHLLIVSQPYDCHGN